MCNKCNRLGHLAKDCRRNNATAKAHHADSDQTHHEEYFFDCDVNGTKTKAYVDTGCGPVVIREKDAIHLKLTWKPCNMSIKGYAGGSAKAVGLANIKLRVDQAEQQVDALIVPNNTQEIPVMIGQEFLNKDGIALLVKEGHVRIMNNQDIPVDMKTLPKRKVAIWAKEVTVVPSGSVAFIAVRIDGDSLGNDYYIEGGFRGQPENEWCVERCITKDGGAVCVANVSSQPLTITPNMVVARGVHCQAENSGSEVMVRQKMSSRYEKSTA
ncbi:hypothetical protein NQ314_013218 [Rhamnusium bicolor]|uniref:CCHC-type domain-containing protein n=1 Tax=Rhamnusium bicolor TaxID=1586634 RepID=A0AAV8X7G7_9CUCU|nr:hypothetical protein NQ314_013218 [Rhamnusium bicolor]